MKILLLSLAFCAVINTTVAQNAVKTNISAGDERVNAIDPKKDIAANIATLKQADIFSRWIKACGLIQTMNDPGPLTVFLPPDSAFNQSPPYKLDTATLSKKKFDLIALITYHALPGKVSAKNIAKEIGRGKGVAVFRTISGAPLKARFDEGGNIELQDESGNKSKLLKTDLKQKNGLIHLISSVLIPKFKSI
ncbi:fasciclin domain-containing protein [Mucilaginibacter calamicampi]|uniref:Fasciclin domain-containing protein n=1 Tax=Mucilaginibacter calamicampi TaxID=1302352 RepID=A0ABW2YSJ1_9SPHI